MKAVKARIQKKSQKTKNLAKVCLSGIRTLDLIYQVAKYVRETLGDWHPSPPKILSEEEKFWKSLP